MALSDSLAIEAGNSLRGPRCTVCTLIATLSRADRDALLCALKNDSVTSAAIARALRRENHAISAITLRRHRKGECLGGVA